MYNIIYIWKGERHQLLRQFADAKKACRVCDELRWLGWNCWIEKCIASS